MKKKIVVLFLCAALSCSILVGCGVSVTKNSDGSGSYEKTYFFTQQKTADIDAYTTLTITGYGYEYTLSDTELYIYVDAASTYAYDCGISVSVITIDGEYEFTSSSVISLGPDDETSTVIYAEIDEKVDEMESIEMTLALEQNGSYYDYLISFTL